MQYCALTTALAIFTKREDLELKFTIIKQKDITAAFSFKNIFDNKKTHVIK